MRCKWAEVHAPLTASAYKYSNFIHWKNFKQDLALDLWRFAIDRYR